jgi:4-amino-4-deoxy-L-arabinose transferase-like glycosyltransferase
MMLQSTSDTIPGNATTDSQRQPTAAEPTAEPGQTRPKTNWLLPTLLCLLFVGQCAWFINTQSLSNDEPLHIIAGTEAWRLHRFERWNDHPPLVFLLTALPLLATHSYIDIQPEAKMADGITPSPQVVAWSARVVNVLLGVLLGLLLWWTARRLFSEGAANFALALYAFCPSLVANFSIDCNDGAVALATFATAMQLVYWRKSPTWGRTVGLALVLGALLSTKFSTPLLFLLALGLVLVLKPDRATWNPREWNWRPALAIAAMSFVFVWGTFFFHSTKVSVQNNMVTASSPNRTKAATGALHVPFNLTVYIPAGEYLEGMGRVANHLKIGHPSFLLGKVKKAGGWKSYFPTVVALKWPPVVLGLFLAAVLLAALKGLHFSSELLLMLVFPAVYFFVAIFSKVDLGERHILLIYPFALLCVAGLWQFTRQHRAVLALLVALVVVNAADTLRYAPDYMSYFTPFVKPAASWHLLTDSNLDWGQGLLALRKYQQQHPDETLHVAYFGTMDPALYGIRYVPLEPHERVSGTVVVSATHLSGQLLDDPDSYRWVTQYPEVAILDHSLHVFKVPEQPTQTTDISSLIASGPVALSR